MATIEYGSAHTQGQETVHFRDLLLVRKQLDLYRLNHKGFFPGDGNADWYEAMTDYTDVYGNKYTEQMAKRNVKRFGPYISDIPENPYNHKDTLRINGKSAGANTHGWYFDSQTGGFKSDSSGYDSQGKPHSEI